MKLVRITAYRVILHTTEGRYSWAKGKHADGYDSTVIRLDTDEGVTGYGEVCCPQAPGYTPYFPEGVRAGAQQVAHALLGQDPTQISVISATMDDNLTGHDYAKSGIDMACWDILGKVAGLPLTTLLGGRFGSDFGLYHPVSQSDPATMAQMVALYRTQGYRCFQLKVGSDPKADIERIQAAAAELQPDEKLVADGNRGWLTHEALTVVNAVRELPVFIEQPCATYEECLTIRRRCNLPMILDESIQSTQDIVRAACDNAADVINLKVSKMGGITKLAQARDLCVRLGIPVFVDNAKGSEITAAAMAHLAHSTPSSYLFATTDFDSYMKETVATGAPTKTDGRLAASQIPGLGVQPITEVLGQPVFEIMA